MSTCTYCQDDRVVWLEVAPGQRLPFDPPPETGLGVPEPPARGPTEQPYVLLRGIARLATAQDLKLLRPLYFRHRCAEYLAARRDAAKARAGE